MTLAIELEHTSNSDAGLITLVYGVRGLTNRPPPVVEAAFARIKAVFDSLDPADLALIKEWNGNPVLYGLTPKFVTTTAEQDAWLLNAARSDAVDRYPGREVMKSYESQNGYDVYVTVVLRPVA